jgi:hypothetical protein
VKPDTKFGVQTDTQPTELCGPVPPGERPEVAQQWMLVESLGERQGQEGMENACARDPDVAGEDASGQGIVRDRVLRHPGDADGCHGAAGDGRPQGLAGPDHQDERVGDFRPVRGTPCSEERGSALKTCLLIAAIVSGRLPSTTRG